LNDPNDYTLAILGDLHLDPRYMNDHEIGRNHFLSIINDKDGNLKPNTCVVSLGDLGESKSVYPDKTKELFAGIISDILSKSLYPNNSNSFKYGLMIETSIFDSFLSDKHKLLRNFYDK
jgi:hypothetical protein